MKILFLHGWTSVVGGRKPTFLQEQGHEVINPSLPDDDFDESVRIAETEHNKHQPDVIVGSSRGGAVAMNMESGDTPLVLLCPAWKKWGEAIAVKKNSIVLHSTNDEVVPFADSEELLDNSKLPRDALIAAGSDHRLADEAPLQALQWAINHLGSGEPLSWLGTQSQLPTIDLGDAAAFVERVTSDFVPHVEQSTIPFYHLGKNEKTNKHEILAKDRTGVFLRIGDDHFVLTASHYLVEAVVEERYLFMSWDDEEDCPIPLAEDQIATTDTTTLDVAAIKLSQRNADKLLKRHRPICLADILRNGRNSSGLYLILGFPIAGTEFRRNPIDDKPTIDSESLKYIAKRTTDGWERDELKYSPLIHLIVGMSRDSYLGTKGELLPDHAGIEGISGCGIWLLADRNWRKSLDEIQVKDCKLVAIEHSYDEVAGKVAGTWMDLVLEFVAMKFPETKAAIEIVYP